MESQENDPPADEPFIYQREGLYFATLAEGLEAWGAEELIALGATDLQPGYRGWHFRATPRDLYRILYCARLFSRVLAPLSRFDCHNPKYLYRRVLAMPWELLLSTEQSFAIHAVTANSALRHSGHTALVVKDAIADRFRAQCGSRPNVDVRQPDVAIHLYVNHNKAVVNIDLSGGSLHRRGYRKSAVEAPMQETLAAGLIHATGWTGQQPLIDPFCGSGTLLCEAWMKVCRIPAGFLRPSYGVQRLPDYCKLLWNEVKSECDGAIHVPKNVPVHGSDIDPAAIKSSRANLANLPEGHRVRLACEDFACSPPDAESIIVTNPPYGVRLGNRSDAEALCKRFGDYLKLQGAGSTAYIYFGDADLVKKLGLKPSWKQTLSNGGLEGQLCRYELYAGPTDQHKARKRAATEPRRT